jgi:nicotinamide-nucleotide amidase
MLAVYPAELINRAGRLVTRLAERSLMLATAESCTGGLIAGLITEIPGSSAVLERGFVTYSNAAKTSMLGVSPDLISEHGAVSAQVARAMAEGALAHSPADLSIAVTGVAGPGGGTSDKPVGLVHLAAAEIGCPTLHREIRLGDIGRTAVRLETIGAALSLIELCLLREPTAKPR